ncbi:calcineurin responsive transcription factor Prz1 [Schizosaccharomyces cryophilus OY26]|uniref:Calcineurin responsive transcription factor Prz1 n=1 Tax=Schizosaccharomyces cryophilus (strain OY26 / ATCC MYA-4695 / CBS 11777 / NBRC 106824 / NRRL Y48691) TaxID=653667 RepID=S9XK40_SCHCR|nr:calcineurin responsive transcription factor Prz1 [Schizosaccharomyces cryophilus OY26]EPY54071.1 calcineurin responsive transcription factor Prz1 [Schizosaccharomyces cryophilus OY26]
MNNYPMNHSFRSSDSPEVYFESQEISNPNGLFQPGLLPLFQDTFESELPPSTFPSQRDSNPHLASQVSVSPKAHSSTYPAVQDISSKDLNVPFFSFTQPNVDAPLEGSSSDPYLSNSEVHSSPFSQLQMPTNTETSGIANSSRSPELLTPLPSRPSRGDIYEFNTSLPLAEIDSSQFLSVRSNRSDYSASPLSSPRSASPFYTPASSFSIPSSPYLRSPNTMFDNADNLNYIDVMSQASAIEDDLELPEQQDFSSFDIYENEYVTENLNVPPADDMQPNASSDFLNSTAGTGFTQAESSAETTSQNVSKPYDVLSNLSTPSFVHENTPAEFSNQSSVEYEEEATRKNQAALNQSSVPNGLAPFSSVPAIVHPGDYKHSQNSDSPQNISLPNVGFPKENFPDIKNETSVVKTETEDDSSLLAPKINVVPSSPAKYVEDFGLEYNSFLAHRERLNGASNYPSMLNASGNISSSNDVVSEDVKRSRSNSAGPRLDVFNLGPQMSQKHQRGYSNYEGYHDNNFGNDDGNPPDSMDHLSINATRPRSRSLNITGSENPITNESAAKKGNSKPENNFVCSFPNCGKRFTRAYNLKSHMNTHTNYRPFQCSICGKSFARQHDKRRHEQLHSGIKAFGCPTCHQRFARMDALNRHYKSEVGQKCLKIAADRGISVPPARRSGTNKTDQALDEDPNNF